MAKTPEIQYLEFPVFKGLQKPLEFMGMQGRYIYWAAGAIGGAILGFIIAYCILGFLAGLIMLAISLGGGAALILIKQRKGLHSKKENKGVFVYAYSKRI
jgi:hypothetical protein